MKRSQCRLVSPASVPASVMAPGGERFDRVAELAAKLLRAHHLHDWKFTYNRRKRALGFCCYTQRTIELSHYFVENNDLDAIVDTLLHEIAHALAGPEHGHNAVWKAKCREIGATPLRLGHAVMPAGKWRAVCRCCGRGYERHRRPKRLRGWYCPPCGVELGKLVWKLTPHQEPQQGLLFF